jgi:2-dehydropantoate 2-reductase
MVMTMPVWESDLSITPPIRDGCISMKIAIIGTGAMGCLFAAKLARFADVTMLGTWREGIWALKERGIYLSEDGREIHSTVRTFSDPSGAGPVDLALVLVKGYQTERAASWARQILKDDGIALTLQNGLGNLEIIAGQVGENRAALGVSMQGATLLGPGRVRHGGRGLTTIAVTTETRARLQSVASLFTQAGFETRLTDDVRTMLWSKLVVNTAINALTAILRVPNGWLAENADARSVMAEAARETATVAQALGIVLPFDDPGARAVEVVQATAANYSSTLQDVLRGTPNELEMINGAVVREGKRLGIPTPVNEALLRLSRAMEQASPSIPVASRLTELAHA